LENSLVTTLVITAIGMSLLFLSLVLFHGIISLLTAVTRERAATPSREGDGAVQQKGAWEERALQAAAIAIALARAESLGGPGRAYDSGSLASGDREVTLWWSLHHQHRLAETGKARRLGR
jgi:Na+-transporting methylmalonyl-CoA/oxaloacetate decarboxylase gamma subunit